MNKCETICIFERCSLCKYTPTSTFSRPHKNGTCFSTSKKSHKGIYALQYQDLRGWWWSGDDDGYLSVPGHSIDWENNWVKAYCACNRRGGGLFGQFFSSYHIPSLSPYQGDGSIQTEILSQRGVKPHTTTKQTLRLCFGDGVNDAHACSSRLEISLSRPQPHH